VGGGATALPSGPIASCSGCPAAYCCGVATVGGASSPVLRPQPVRASAATSAPTTAIFASMVLADGIKKALPNSRSIADHVSEARPWRNRNRGKRGSGPLLGQRLEPAGGFPAHIFGGGAAIAHTAFDRIFHRDHGQIACGDARFDRLHLRKPKLGERRVRRGS